MHRCRAMPSAMLLCCALARAQTVAFELQTVPDGPVTLVDFSPTTFRVEADRRQFFTVKNESDKVAIALVFQEAMGSASGTEIVALERVSIIIRPREKKRLSVSVGDVWKRVQNAGQASQATGKPVVSVVVVEFVDGSVWNAPTEREHK